MHCRLGLAISRRAPELIQAFRGEARKATPCFAKPFPRRCVRVHNKFRQSAHRSTRLPRRRTTRREARAIAPGDRLSRALLGQANRMRAQLLLGRRVDAQAHGPSQDPLRRRRRALRSNRSRASPELQRGSHLSSPRHRPRDRARQHVPRPQAASGVSSQSFYYQGPNSRPLLCSALDSYIPATDYHGRETPSRTYRLAFVIGSSGAKWRRGRCNQSGIRSGLTPRRLSASKSTTSSPRRGSA